MPAHLEAPPSSEISQKVFYPIENHNAEIDIGLARDLLYGDKASFPIVHNLGRNVGQVVFFKDRKITPVSDTAVAVQAELLRPEPLEVKLIMRKCSLTRKVLAALRGKEEPVPTSVAIYHPPELVQS